MTQPRKLAARAVSRHISKRKGWGNRMRGAAVDTNAGICGYWVGLDKYTSPDTRIVYMTPGIVSRCMQANRLVLVFPFFECSRFYGLTVDRLLTFS